MAEPGESANSKARTYSSKSFARKRIMYIFWTSTHQYQSIIELHCLFAGHAEIHLVAS